MNGPEKFLHAASWLLLSLISALLLNLAFPYPGISHLAWVALAPLFVVILTGRFGRVFLASVVTGFLFNVVYLLWMKEYKHPASLSGGVFAEMVFFSFAVLVAWALSSGTVRFKGLALAVGWLAVDYIKTIGFLGFPWGILGYTQYKNLLLIQNASVFGVWGIDFLILYANALVATSVVEYLKTGSLRSLRTRTVPAAAFSGILIAFVLFGAWAIGREKEAGHETRRLALVQANFDPWSPQLTENLLTEMELTTRALEMDPDLVVWSESSVPFPYEFYLARNNKYARIVRDFARAVERPFLFGTLEFVGTYDEGEFRGDFYNVAVFYDQGRLEGTYRKIHLVPFGEWFPFERIFPFVVKILEAAGAGDFKPGTEYMVFDADGFTFSVLICFEDVFGELTRRFVGARRPGEPQRIVGARRPGEPRRFVDEKHPGGARRSGYGRARAGRPAHGAPAGLLINVTNDAWTGSRKAEEQHFSISVFRAVENRRGFARAANGGVTACVNTFGEVIASLELFTSDVLVCDVPLNEAGKPTFYSMYGDLPIRFIVILAGFGLLASIIKKVIDRNKKKHIM